MEALGLYLLKSVIWLTGFALVYYLFLRNERFFIINRLFLITGILVSMVFPFISIHYVINLPLVPEYQTGILTSSGIQETKTFSFFDLIYPLALLYVLGVIFIAFGLLKQCRIIIKVIKKANAISSEPVKLIRTSDYQSSFSFFSYVFVNPSISDLETKEIVNHELAHIRQCHWIDLVLAELLCIIQWFNPVIWIYIRFIRHNHEYLADEVALQQTADPAVYKATLLNQIVGVPVVSLANSFNYSINKKRFTMMKNIISSPYRRMKILFVLPVFAIVLYAFAEPEYKYISVNESTADKAVYPDLQTKEVKGIIREQGGKPLQGATIVLKGTTNGVTADLKGFFKLADVPDDGVLIVSYVGFKTKSIKPVFTSDMTIQLFRDTVTLGTVGPPSPPPPMSPPPPPSGTLNIIPAIPGPPPPPPPPGEGISVRMSGLNPPLLIVVNGVVSDLKSEQIDPNTIESITVIKDESAKVLYGEKGKNGVLQIMLKPGTKMLDLNTPITVTGYKLQSDDKNYKDKIQGNPLYVIDGVVSDKKNLDDISPEDIESVNVIKGIKATDKYGETARDGVVEINTKRPGYQTKSDLEPISVVGYSTKQPMVITEEMPMYPGGQEALQSWIADHLKYPGDALNHKISGDVPVSFTVDKTGKVTDVKVITSVDPLLDKEAIRVVSSMPDWKPGSQNGTAVNVRMLVRVNFDLNQKVSLDKKLK